MSLFNFRRRLITPKPQTDAELQPEVEEQPETLPGLQPLPEHTLRAEPAALAGRLRALSIACRKLSIDLDSLCQSEYHTDLLSLTTSEFRQLLHALRQAGSVDWVHAWRDPYAGRVSYLDLAAGYPVEKTAKQTDAALVSKLIHKLQAQSAA